MDVRKTFDGFSELGPDYMNRAGPVSRAGVSLPGSRHVC